MTSGPHTPPHPAPRLRLKPKEPTTGYVDGAWWPRSGELAGELPALLAVLAVRLGRIERVTYPLATWALARRRLVVDGAVVRLEGFRSQHADTVTVVGTSGTHRLTLLVVPPDTESVFAHRVLMAAAHRENDDTIETLLAGEAVQPADQRWEAEGGRLHVPA